jgi:HEPN domain-containing protein
VTERSADWLAQAEDDLAISRKLVEGDWWAAACFHAHEAAENALKAVYQRRGARALGHSLKSLASALRDAPPEVVEQAAYLARYYIASRHPDAFESGTPKDHLFKEDAERAISAANRVLAWSRDHLA